MCRRGLAGLFVAVSVPIVAAPRRGNESVPDGLELARSSIRAGQSFAFASQLTAMGSRVSGSPSYRRAAEWSADRFRAIGIEKVALEPFTIERGWERLSARARVIAPVDRPLQVESLGWSPSTPDGGLEAEVVALDTFSLTVVQQLYRRRCHVVGGRQGED